MRRYLALSGFGLALCAPCLLVARDVVAHDQRAFALIDEESHPPGTRHLQSRWRVGDFFGQGEANCDILAAELRSGRLSDADLHRYREHRGMVWMLGPDGWRPTGSSPSLPDLGWKEWRDHDAYVVVWIEDAVSGPGLDPRCF